VELLEGGSGLVAYLALKTCGYILWCYIGLRWFERDRRRPIIAAIVRGAARLALGWLTGLLVAPLAIAAAGTDHIPLFYFTALVLVRWFEWAVIQASFRGVGRGGVAFATGGDGRGRLWRAGGVVVSYLADAPFLLTDGFPHGRIFC
jgi:hypothetical protein